MRPILRNEGSAAREVHALMVVSGISMSPKSQESSSLGSTLTDKINVENFCYNFMDYRLHKTIQLSEGDAAELRELAEADPAVLGGRDWKGWARRAVETKVERRLRRFFRRKRGQDCLLFLSGHGERGTGNLILNALLKASLSLENVLNAWDDCAWGAGLEEAAGRPARQSHLLIIADACYSGVWVRKMEETVRRTDVSVQSSCRADQKSYENSSQGGTFLSNFLYLNGLRDIKYTRSYRASGADGAPARTQTPTFYSQSAELERVYGLQTRLTSWEQLEWRNAKNLEGEFKAENGLDKLSGSFKSLLLDGQGEKHMACGRTERGVFSNDRLSGAGTLVWKDFRVSGTFENGRLVSLERVRPTLGGLSTKEFPAFPRRYSLEVHDDSVRELLATGLGRVAWAKSFYVDGLVTEAVQEMGVKNGFGFFQKPGEQPSVAWWANGRIEILQTFLRNGQVEVVNFRADRSRMGEGPDNNTVNGLGANSRQMLSSTSIRIEGPSPKEVRVESSNEEDLAFFELRTVKWEQGAARGARLAHPAGDWVFEGELKDGKPYGRGVFRRGESVRVEGTWVAGVLQGKAAYQVMGQRGEGSFVKGQRAGFGQTLFANGDSYAGEFRWNRLLGRGVYEWAEGATFEGVMFRDEAGLLTGLGRLRVPRSQALQFFLGGGRPDTVRPGSRKEGLRRQEPDFSLEEYLDLGRPPAPGEAEDWVVFEGQLLRGKMHSYGRLRVGGQTMEGIFFENLFKRQVDFARQGVSYRGEMFLLPDLGTAVAPEKDRWICHGTGRLTVDGPKATDERLAELGSRMMEGTFKFNKLVAGSFEVEYRGARIRGRLDRGSRFFTGEIRMPSGLAFEGRCEGFVPAGLGVLTMPSGRRFRVDMERGFVRLSVAGLALWDGSVYQGFVLCSFAEAEGRLLANVEFLHGEGEVRFPDGDWVQGVFRWSLLGRLTFRAENGLLLNSAPPRARKEPAWDLGLFSLDPFSETQVNEGFSFLRDGDGGRDSAPTPRWFGVQDSATELWARRKRTFRSLHMREGVALTLPSGLQLEWRRQKGEGRFEGTLTYPDGSLESGVFAVASTRAPADPAHHVTLCTFETEQSGPAGQPKTLKEVALQKHGAASELAADGLEFTGTYLCNRRWGPAVLSTGRDERVEVFFANDLCKKKVARTLGDGRVVREACLTTPRLLPDKAGTPGPRIGFDKVRSLGWGRVGWPDGSSYVGGLKDDLPHGVGVLRRGKSLFRGSFEEGVRHGEGLEVGEGRVVTGAWQKDRLVSVYQEAAAELFPSPGEVVHFEWVDPLEPDA